MQAWICICGAFFHPLQHGIAARTGLRKAESSQTEHALDLQWQLRRHEEQLQQTTGLVGKITGCARHNKLAAIVLCHLHCAGHDDLSESGFTCRIEEGEMMLAVQVGLIGWRDFHDGAGAKHGSRRCVGRLIDDGAIDCRCGTDEVGGVFQWRSHVQLSLKCQRVAVQLP